MITYLMSSTCYLSVFVWMMYCLYHLKGMYKTSYRVLALLILTLGLCLHAWALYPQIITDVGLNFNVFNMVSLTSLFCMLFFLLFCQFRPVLSLGILACPTAFLGLTASTFGVAPYQSMNHISHGLQVHILLSMAAYSAFLMAAIQAIILRLQIRELKHQSQQRLWVSKLPSLQSMESLLFDMILLAFFLLTVALLLGFIYVDNFLTQHLIAGHWRYGWRGKKACNFTLYGYGLLAIGFVGSKTVLELLINS